MWGSDASTASGGMDGAGLIGSSSEGASSFGRYCKRKVRLRGCKSKDDDPSGTHRKSEFLLYLHYFLIRLLSFWWLVPGMRQDGIGWCCLQVEEFFESPSLCVDQPHRREAYRLLTSLDSALDNNEEK